MALKKAKSKQTVGKNIKELETDYKKSSKASASRFKSSKKAQKKAAATTSNKSKYGKKKQVNENFILGFIKSLVDKNYAEADKYLQGQVDKIVSNKIKDAVAQTN